MAINNPSISNYKPFYIQIGENCYDTRTQWGMIAKSSPYPALPKPKEPYANSWNGENGLQEYVTTMTYEPFEFSVQFYIRAEGATAPADVRGAMSNFFTAIRNGYFKVFDSDKSLGRQNVRYAGFKEDSFSAYEGYARCVFTITFKVDDPITFMQMSNGKIVAV